MVIAGSYILGLQTDPHRLVMKMYNSFWYFVLFFLSATVWGTVIVKTTWLVCLLSDNLEYFNPLPCCSKSLSAVDRKKSIWCNIDKIAKLNGARKN